jgi:predicted thioesterase
VCFQYTQGGPAGWIRYLWLSLILGRPQPFARIWRGKPKVQGTGNLVGVLEWPAMDAIRPYLEPGQDVLGTAVDIVHRAPVWRGVELLVTARCISRTGRRSRWWTYAGYYREDDQFTIVAAGILGFSVVDVATFLDRSVPSGWTHWRARPRWRHRLWMWLRRPWTGGQHTPACHLVLDDERIPLDDPAELRALSDTR